MGQVMGLHQFDCLRANKSTMAWGVEARVPFLDADFLEYAMSVDPECKVVPKPNGMEKDVLRRAFDTPEDPCVPRGVLS
jgi:asparagine synthase (glutamine-hydrolysing)